MEIEGFFSSLNTLQFFLIESGMKWKENSTTLATKSEISHAPTCLILYFDLRFWELDFDLWLNIERLGKDGEHMEFWHLLRYMSIHVCMYDYRRFLFMVVGWFGEGLETSSSLALCVSQHFSQNTWRIKQLDYFLTVILTVKEIQIYKQYFKR